MQQRGLALPGAADPDGEVEPPGRLPGERLAGLARRRPAMPAGSAQASTGRLSGPAARTAACVAA